MKKCIVIPDSFKGSLSSIDICKISKKAIQEFFPDCEVVSLPIGDGGEGTADCFLEAMNGEKVSVKVTGPNWEPITACYARIDDIAVIEMAAAAGLPLVGTRKNPEKTTTYGVGELIKHAVLNGAKKIILGLGGSGTNDGGCGAASALGAKFFDGYNNFFIPVGGTLNKIKRIDITEVQKLLKDCEITAMCDVESTMYGSNGAAYQFAPQKGADENMVKRLDENLFVLNEVIANNLGIKNLENIPGTGAAGAMGAGCMAFLNAKLKSGIETVLDLVEFENKLKDTDIVFTGEGRIDSQSICGKVISGVAKRAKLNNVPVVVIAGDVSDDAYAAYDIGVSAIFSINRLAVPFDVAKERSSIDYEHTLSDILRLIKLSENYKKTC